MISLTLIGHIDHNIVSEVRSGLFFTWNVCLFILKYEANVGSQYLCFHKSTRLGCSVLFWTAETVTSSVFCSIKHVFILISSGSEHSSTRTQRMSFSAAIVATLASSEQCLTHHRFRLINVLHRFLGAERSPVLTETFTERSHKYAQERWKAACTERLA